MAWPAHKYVCVMSIFYGDMAPNTVSRTTRDIGMGKVPTMGVHQRKKAAEATHETVWTGGREDAAPSVSVVCCSGDIARICTVNVFVEQNIEKRQNRAAIRVTNDAKREDNVVVKDEIALSRGGGLRGG